MKTHRFFFALLCTATLVFTSCNNSINDDDLIPNADAGSGEITASVDGDNFVSKNSVDGATILQTNGSVTIQGWTSDDAYISLTVFAANFTIGTTYTSNTGEAIMQYQPVFNGGDAYSTVAGGGSNGSVTFSTFNDNKIAGSFEFLGILNLPDGTTDEVNVTNGTFEFDL